MLGVTAKFLVSNNILILVDPILENPDDQNLFTNFLAFLLLPFIYYAELFFYLNTTSGILQVFGFKRLLYKIPLPVGFNTPTDYWQKWRIPGGASLNRFICKKIIFFKKLSTLSQSIIWLCLSSLLINDTTSRTLWILLNLAGFTVFNALNKFVNFKKEHGVPFAQKVASQVGTVVFIFVEYLVLRLYKPMAIKRFVNTYNAKIDFTFLIHFFEKQNIVFFSLILLGVWGISLIQNPGIMRKLERGSFVKVGLFYTFVFWLLFLFGTINSGNSVFSFLK